MTGLLHSHSPFRIFATSAVLTIIILASVAFGMGPQALVTAVILMLVELTFSFDNAIVNARVLQHMSPLWQRLFMTVGIVIAVFGMRILFPIVLVMITAGLDFGSVIDLALHHSDKYAAILTHAHPLIASFGGMFLLMLALDFFFEDKDVHWIKQLEKWLQRIGRRWLSTVVALVVLVVIALLPANAHPQQTLSAGITGIVVYLLVHGLSLLFHAPKSNRGQTAAMAGLMSFIYLEVLDASFSFDGVIGAFAITQNVVLIAIGLGIGALWVRSLTLFIVRRGTLATYRYLDHGAHYTILMLACVLLGGLFMEVPEYVPGVLGIAIIGWAFRSSIFANRSHKQL